MLKFPTVTIKKQSTFVSVPIVKQTETRIVIDETNITIIPQLPTIVSIQPDISTFQPKPINDEHAKAIEIESILPIPSNLEALKNTLDTMSRELVVTPEDTSTMSPEFLESMASTARLVENIERKIPQSGAVPDNVNVDFFIPVGLDSRAGDKLKEIQDNLITPIDSLINFQPVIPVGLTPFIKPDIPLFIPPLIIHPRLPYIPVPLDAKPVGGGVIVPSGKGNKDKVIDYKILIEDTLTKISKFTDVSVHPLQLHANKFNEHELNLYADVILVDKKSLKVYLINDYVDRVNFEMLARDDKGVFHLLNSSENTELAEYSIYEKKFNVDVYKNIDLVKINVFNLKGHRVKEFKIPIAHKNTTEFKLNKTKVSGDTIHISVFSGNTSFTDIQNVFKNKSDLVIKKDVEDLVLKTQNFPELLFQDSILKNFPDALKIDKANLTNNIINYISSQEEVKGVLGTETFDEKYKRSQILDMTKGGINSFINENKVFLIKLKMEAYNQFSIGEYLLFNTTEEDISALPFGNYILELYYLYNNKFKFIDFETIVIREPKVNEGLFVNLQAVHLSDHDVNNMIAYWSTKRHVDYCNVKTFYREKLMEEYKIKTTVFEFDNRATDRIELSAYDDDVVVGSYGFTI